MTSPSPNSCAATVIDRDTTGRIDGSAAQESPGAEAAGAGVGSVGAGVGEDVPADVLASLLVLLVLASAPVLARRCLRRIATAHRPAEARVTKSAICPT